MFDSFFGFPNSSQKSQTIQTQNKFSPSYRYILFLLFLSIHAKSGGLIPYSRTILPACSTGHSFDSRLFPEHWHDNCPKHDEDRYCDHSRNTMIWLATSDKRSLQWYAETTHTCIPCFVALPVLHGIVLPSLFIVPY